MFTSPRGWVAMILSIGTLYCFALKVTHWQHFSMCSFACTAIWGQKKWLCIRLSIFSRPKWPISSWHLLRVVPWWVAGKTSWNRASQDSFDRTFYMGCPTSNWGGCILGGAAAAWVDQSVWRCIGPASHPTSSQLKGPGQVCLLGLMLITGGHAGNLWTIPYQVQYAQVVAVCLNEACRTFEGGLLHGSHHHCCDPVVCVQSIGNISGPGHPLQGICINVSLPCSTVQLKVIIGKAGHPAMTHIIQLCCH